MSRRAVLLSHAVHFKKRIKLVPRLKDKNAGGPVQDGTEGHCGQSVGGEGVVV